MDLESFLQLLLLLPLKELDNGLLKRTGPSSGVVASIVLVSPGLDCPGVSLVEVCATCLCGSLVIEVQYLDLYFHELEKNLNECGTHISHVQNILFISSECPFQTGGAHVVCLQVQ